MRNFSKKQKRILYHFSGGYCQICNNLLPNVWHADHIIPYSKGGKTTITNGQALCPKCNLIKGAKLLHLRDLPKGYKLRTWQQRCYDEYIAILKECFLLTATPGAGKTDLAILIARTLLSRQLADMIIVVTPFKNLKDQWLDDSNRLGCDFYSDFVIDDLSSLIVMPENEYHGLVTSYQQVASGSSSEAFRKFCYKYKVMVIFDEPHHCSTENSWGESMYDAFNLAKYKLCITGTPYRTDKDNIPFVEYKKTNDGYISIADFEYSYGEAINEPEGEKVVRLVQFPKFDGEMTWIEKVAQEAEDGLFEWGTEPITKTMTFEDRATIRESASRLNTALMADGGWVKAILEAANDHLDRIREFEQTDAGGVIFARDISHAKSIRTIAKNIINEDLVIVTNEDKHPGSIIKSFDKSNKKWIIAVKMISEGINIKRLRVGVFMTNITTRMFFVQVLGRILRYQSDVGEPQESAFFVPSVEPYITYINEIFELVAHVITENENKERGPNTGGSEQNNWTEYVNSTGQEKDRDYKGILYTPQEIEEAEKMLKNLKLEGERSVIQMAEAIRDMFKKEHSSTNDTSKSEPESKADRVKKLRKKCHTKTADLRIKVIANGIEIEYWEIANTLANKFNGYARETTEDGWHKKIDWLDRAIISANNKTFHRGMLEL